MIYSKKSQIYSTKTWIKQIKTMKKCVCGIEIPEEIELCPACLDKAQLQAIDEREEWEMNYADSLLNQMKDD